MNGIIESNKRLRNETKARIDKPVARLILTYTAQTRADLTNTENILEVSEMTVLRKKVKKK